MDHIKLSREKGGDGRGDSFLKMGISNNFATPTPTLPHQGGGR